MNIHATSVRYFVNVPTSDALSSIRNLDQALNGQKRLQFPVELKEKCRDNGKRRSVIEVTCVGPEAGEVMRIIEGVQA